MIVEPILYRKPKKNFVWLYKIGKYIANVFATKIMFFGVFLQKISSTEAFYRVDDGFIERLKELGMMK